MDRRQGEREKKRRGGRGGERKRSDKSSRYEP